ncbi:MAG TPA: YciI family protein [Streptosporangiaceae bacterium]|jgi:hypothetical protein
MKYLLLICTEGIADAGQAKGDPERAKAPALAAAWGQEMERRGVMVLGSPVRPASEATTVRLREGQVLLTDGPYAETKEQIGGFDIIDCQDLDEAIEIAAKHPMARFGMIDIRALYG